MGEKTTPVANKKWSEELLFEKRKEVLAMWPTGADIDLEEATTDEIGRLLNILAMQLGTVSATLIDRGAPAEIIDKHIKASCLKGVDRYFGETVDPCCLVEDQEEEKTQVA